MLLTFPSYASSSPRPFHPLRRSLAFDHDLSSSVFDDLMLDDFFLPSDSSLSPAWFYSHSTASPVRRGHSRTHPRLSASPAHSHYWAIQEPQPLPLPLHHRVVSGQALPDRPSTAGNGRNRKRSDDSLAVPTLVPPPSPTLSPRPMQCRSPSAFNSQGKASRKTGRIIPIEGIRPIPSRKSDTSNLTAAVHSATATAQSEEKGRLNQSSSGSSHMVKIDDAVKETKAQSLDSNPSARAPGATAVPAPASASHPGQLSSASSSSPMLSSVNVSSASASPTIPGTPCSAVTVEEEPSGDEWLNLDASDFVNYKERITQSPK